METAIVDEEQEHVVIDGIKYKVGDEVGEEVPKLVPRFRYVRDDLSYFNIVGMGMSEVLENMKTAAKANPNGMVCSVAIIDTKQGKVFDRVGPYCHVDENGDINLKEWFESLKESKTIKDYFDQ